MALAVNAGAVATPPTSVIAIADTAPPVKVPDAPPPGALNATLMPGKRLLLVSLTTACIGIWNVVPGGAFCGVPAITEMLAAAGRFVRSYVIGRMFGPINPVT